MSKLVLTDVTSGYASTTAVNANNALVEAAIENTLSRDGTGPNTMNANLDMNGYAILNALATSGYNFYWMGTWLTTTAYSVNNLVLDSGSAYICLVAHTSGTFATDLAAGKWQVFASKGSPGAGTGDLLAANNLSDLASAATARANLGIDSFVSTFLTTPTSANLLAAVTNETGTGALVFATSPTLVTPLLGTPTSGTLTNCTGLPVTTGISGLGTGIATFLATPSSANLLAATTDETGTGALVFATSPTLVTPALGTPTALVGTNITGTGASFTAGAATLAASSSALKSATTTVDVSAATAPTVGQVLMATSGSAATWQANTLTGAATPTTLLASDYIKSSSSTAGIGYATGAGGTVTQVTSIGTAVTLNKICGDIITVSYLFSANSQINFTLNNSTIGADDIVDVHLVSANIGAEALLVVTRGVLAGSVTIYMYSIGGTSNTAYKIRFAVRKNVIA